MTRSQSKQLALERSVRHVSRAMRALHKAGVTEATGDEFTSSQASYAAAERALEDASGHLIDALEYEARTHPEAEIRGQGDRPCAN